MRKIIENKIYDTESKNVKLLAEKKDKNGDFERFYKTEKNNCFCHYSSSDGEDITKLTIEEIDEKLAELHEDEIKWENFEEA